MEFPEQIQVKVISSPKVIEEFKSDWSAQSDQIQILSSGPERNMSSYPFGLMEAAALVAIVQGGVYFVELGAKLFRYLKANSNEGKKIIIQTPLGRWEFVSRDDLTENEVKDVLKRLAGVNP